VDWLTPAAHLKWLIRGAFGRKTERRASRALEAAERIDAAALSAEWDRGRKMVTDRRSTEGRISPSGQALELS
jgi:hypothetical protein